MGREHPILPVVPFFSLSLPPPIFCYLCPLAFCLPPHHSQSQSPSFLSPPPALIPCQSHPLAFCLSPPAPFCSPHPSTFCLCPTTWTINLTLPSCSEGSGGEWLLQFLTPHPCLLGGLLVALIEEESWGQQLLPLLLHLPELLSGRDSTCDGFFCYGYLIGMVAGGK